MGSRLPVLVVVVLLSCAHTPHEGTEEKARGGPWYGDLHALAQKAAVVRQMTLTQPFEVVPLADTAFFEALDSLETERTAQLQREVAELMQGVAFAAAPDAALKKQLAAQAKSVRNEQIIAFYHFESHRLLVREVLPASIATKSARMQLGLLAHEVGHVLQDQKGFRFDTTQSFEQLSATRAVLEGDATLTSTLLDAAAQGIAGERAVERTRLGLSALTREQLIEFAGSGSPQLVASNGMFKELTSFPYFAGQRFSADLYAAGGLTLVDAALKAPPARTVDVLHPQEWLDGADHLHPMAPNARRLGAVLFRGLYAMCAQGTERAEQVAWVDEHLRDDSFVRVGDSLVWATLWSDATSQAPVRVMNTIAGCMGARADAVEVTPKGNVTVLSVRRSNDLKQSTTASPRTSSQMPHGKQVVPAIRPGLAYRSLDKGVVVDNQWRQAQLGLAFDGVSSGTVVDVPVMTLMFTTDGAVLAGVFLDEPHSDEAAGAFTNGLLSALKKTTGGYPLGTQHPWQDRALGTLKARFASVRVADGTRAVSLALPLCQGNAAFYVVGVAFTPKTEATINRWVDSWRSTGSASICDER